MNSVMIDAMTPEDLSKVHAALTEIAYYMERYYDGPCNAASDKEYMYYMRTRKAIRARALELTSNDE